MAPGGSWRRQGQDHRSRLCWPSCGGPHPASEARSAWGPDVSEPPPGAASDLLFLLLQRLPVPSGRSDAQEAGPGVRPQLDVGAQNTALLGPSLPSVDGAAAVSTGRAGVEQSCDCRR